MFSKWFVTLGEEGKKKQNKTKQHTHPPKTQTKATQKTHQTKPTQNKQTKMSDRERIKK